MESMLTLKPDYEAAKARWLAFWEQELIERPCCVIRAPREGIQPAPAPRYLSGAREDLHEVARQVLAHLETIWWGGEAMPCYTPSFGPDMMAAWLGTDLEFDDREFGTNWVVANIEDWETSLPIRLEPDNYWWQRMLEFCAILAETFAGKAALAHLDLHSNMDTLSAMRSPARLCMDMMDIPETIDRAMADVQALYRPIYEGLYAAGRMQQTGTCGWVPAYHPVRTNTIQCDFAALIGPEHFRRWVLPALEEEAAFLGHSVYHLDGPECLVHVPDLCSINGLDCIQWVSGARNKPFIEWMDLLKDIQARGKSVWVPCDPESIKIFHRELKPNRIFYVCSVPDRATGERTLQWLADNT